MKGYICSFLAAVLVFISGCGTIQVKENRDSFLVITDSAAREVTIPKKPERIVLLTPTLAEIQNALGGSFIGMAAPSEKTVKMYGADKSYVGRPYQINMEQLVSLKPDLVIGLQGKTPSLATWQKKWGWLTYFPIRLQKSWGTALRSVWKSWR